MFLKEVEFLGLVMSTNVPTFRNVDEVLAMFNLELGVLKGLADRTTAPYDPNQMHRHLVRMAALCVRGALLLAEPQSGDARAIA